MKKLAGILAASVVLFGVIGSAQAADAQGPHKKYVHHAVYHPVSASYAYAGPNVEPLLYVLSGAGIGAIVGAVVCPPCAIAGTALTVTTGALIGAGIGAVGGAVVYTVVAQPRNMSIAGL